MGDRTYIIAEAGVNHNGSLGMAKRLIDAAVEAGADAVKFQTFKAEKLVSRFAEKADYQKRLTDGEESQYAMLKWLELSENDHLDLILHCNAQGITFISTPFDEESANLLERLGVAVFKIPSGEITNLPFLRHVAGKEKPLLISTGMSTIAEVSTALKTVFETGNNSVSLLHCVTEYPAPVEQINLRAMATMRQAFGVPVGYSDHSAGIEIAVAAVAVGATLIEKHFTLDRTLPGPDHQASLEPAELAQMVRCIRNVESAMGDGIKCPAPCELPNMKVARKSIIASRPLKRGELLSGENIAIKRPGNGISPADLEKVLGLAVMHDISAEEAITWEMLKQ